MDVTQATIEAAAARLRGHAVQTPLLENDALNERLGGRLLIKAETFQRGGSFKFRGAFNRLAQLTPHERQAGVVAFSSGNHAQGVALAARLVGCSALIVMPADAPLVKREATERLGATLHLYDRVREDRVAIATGIAAARGAVLVPSFDDPDVIAGQGTIGLEILEQLGDQADGLDLMISPVGGGGLISGTGLALQQRLPSISVIGVEPQGFDDCRRSLEAGAVETNAPGGQSLCDALLTPSPSALTLAIMQRVVNAIVMVDDAQVAQAMSLACSLLKLVVEPGGAVGLAALLAGEINLAGRTAAVILSGGNVDPQLYAAALQG